MPDEHTTPFDTSTQQEESKKPKVTYFRREKDSYVEVKKGDNQPLSELLISVRDSSAQQTRSESETSVNSPAPQTRIDSETSQKRTTSDEFRATFRALITDDDADCKKLYEYLKMEMLLDNISEKKSTLQATHKA